MKFAVAIPALNAAVRTDWIAVLESYSRQSVQPALYLLADSGSTDSTVADAEEYGWEIMPVHRHDFNHGATRQKIVQKLAEAGFDAVVFAVQDACPATSDTIQLLLEHFQATGAAVAYARQVPWNPESMDGYFRLRNYPPVSSVRKKEDIQKLGLMTAFCSNVLAVWNIDKVMKADGFPATAFGEDMLLAATLILHGEKIAYCAESICYHEHSGTLPELWTRGIAIGRMHGQNPWLYEKFGRPETCVRRHICIRDFLRFSGSLLSKYTGFLYGYTETKIRTFIPLMLFLGAMLAGGMLIWFNRIPANDTCTRYAPMAEAFAAGYWEYAFHPMYGVFFPSLSGMIVRFFHLNGFRACQIAALFLWAVSIFPLYELFKKLWDRKIALISCCLYLLCSKLHRYVYDGLRDNGRTLGLALLALGLIVLLPEKRNRAWWFIASGGAILTLLRADGLLFALVALFIAFAADLRQNGLRCWRSICATLLFLLLILPQLYLTWKWTGYPVVSARHAELLERYGNGNKDE